MSVRSKVNNFRFIRSLLEGMGYNLAIVKGKHRAFSHARKDHPLILLPGGDRYVTPAHVQMVRGTLREAGLMQPEEFDRCYGEYAQSARPAARRAS